MNINTSQPQGSGASNRKSSVKDPVNLIDTHIHTNFSDGLATVAQVEEACRRKKIGCIITDHNEIRASVKLVERRTVPAIPGLEIGSKEQIELIVYFKSIEECESFYKKHIEPYRKKRLYAFLPRPLDAIVSGAREYDSLISIPHPFAPLWKNINHGRKRQGVLGQTLDEADCIEVWNGSLSDRANDKAMLLCQTLSKIPLGGSDSHNVENIGSVTVALEKAVTHETMFNALCEAGIVGLFGQDARPRYVSSALNVARKHSTKLLLPSGGEALKQKIKTGLNHFSG